MPGVLADASADGSAAWAGVLMPSVDRVGRYFPLTLARPLPELPADAAQLNDLLGWLQRLDDLALDALHDDWSVDGSKPSWSAGRVDCRATASDGRRLPDRGPRRPGSTSGRAAASPHAGASAHDALLQRLAAQRPFAQRRRRGSADPALTAGLPSGTDFSTLLSRDGDPIPFLTSLDLQGTHDLTARLGSELRRHSACRRPKWAAKRPVRIALLGASARGRSRPARVGRRIGRSASRCGRIRFARGCARGA
jgi:hypothetical protein